MYQKLGALITEACFSSASVTLGKDLCLPMLLLPRLIWKKKGICDCFMECCEDKALKLLRCLEILADEEDTSTIAMTGQRSFPLFHLSQEAPL